MSGPDESAEGGEEGEFAFIRRRLAPLSKGFPGALNLTDDGALLDPPPGARLVTVADLLVAGRHFPDSLDGATAARKALRANLSDLAAMGAEPWAYLLCLALPEGAPARLRQGVADGLALDQAEFAVHLAGGDTTVTSGPFTLCVTAFGLVPGGEAPVLRSGARAGDLLMVTGRIGEAAAGLALMSDPAPVEDEAARRALIRRSLLPTPRTACAAAIRRHARAAIDVSDGLLADIGHVAAASGLRAQVDLDKVPFGEAAARWAASGPGRRDPVAGLLALATGGDDYELVCAVPPEAEDRFAHACAAVGVEVGVIGRLEPGEGVEVRHAGVEVRAERRGFTHF